MIFPNGPKSPESLNDEDLDTSIATLCAKIRKDEEINAIRCAALSLAVKERRRRLPPRKMMFCLQCDDRIGCFFAHPCKHGHDDEAPRK